VFEPEPYDDPEDGWFIRTCGHCGTRTEPRWSESSSLEEARRWGWRRVAVSDRPGAQRLDLCGRCAVEAGYGAPMAKWWS
jgi:hypothetical protein